MSNETLKPAAKLQDDVQHVEALKHLIVQKKSEFDALVSKITLYKTQLMSLENRLVTMQSEHDAKLRAEKKAFEEEMNKKKNEIVHKLSEVNRAEADMIKRRGELEVRERNNEVVREERSNLLELKLKYENLCKDALMKMEHANKVNEQAEAIIAEAARRKAETEKMLIESKNMRSIVEQKEEELAKRELDVKQQLDNLSNLRKEVGPQMEELKSLIEKKKHILSEIDKRNQEINNKILEETKLVAEIDEKKKRLREQANELKTKEEELLRKEIFLKNQ